MRTGEGMKIAALERVAATTRSTIRHYLQLGLLHQPRVAGPKLHLFDRGHVERLAAIARLRAEGLSLSRIRDELQRQPPPRGSGTEPGAPEAELRERIRARATALFAEYGYDGVRLSDVAQQLGIGKASIYRHYESKHALFVDCVESVRHTLVPAEARAANERDHDLRHRGARRAAAVLDHFDAYRMLNHMLAALAHGQDEALARKARAELHAMITNAEPFLRELAAAGAIRPLDTELLAYMLWGALLGAGELLGRDGRHSRHDVLRGYLDFVDLGMRGSAASVEATT
jgi:AcrR family transcriptional regulator